MLNYTLFIQDLKYRFVTLEKVCDTSEIVISRSVFETRIVSETDAALQLSITWPRRYRAEGRDTSPPPIHFPTSEGSMSLINERTLSPSSVTKFWSTLKITISPALSLAWKMHGAREGEKISFAKLGNTATAHGW